MYNGNYQIPEKPEYQPDIRALKDSDPAQASVTFNPLFQRIIENTAAVKNQADEATRLVEGKADLDPITHKVKTEQLPDMDYDPGGTAATAVNAHNESSTAHLELRQLTTEAKTTADDAGRIAMAATEAAGRAQETADAALEVITKLAHTINAIPSQNGTLVYTGSAQSPSWNSYNPEALTLGGVTTGTNAGTYTASFIPKQGYTWEDGTNMAKSVTWSIGRAIIKAPPSQSNGLTYTGNAQSPSWINYNTAQLTIGGTLSATDAGSYSATFTPTSNYQWSDGTITAKSFPWSIGRAIVSPVPSQNKSLTYNGNVQSPDWINYNTAQLTIGGTLSATDAGSYSATFTPTSNYQWTNGSTITKSTSWRIDKAAGSLTLNQTSMTLNLSNITGTITATRLGDGTVTATSSNTGVATVSVSGTNVTVTGKAYGSATVTVSVAAGTNYNAPVSKTCTVTVNLFKSALYINSWEAVRAASDAEEGANYWAVGDTKNITINGTVGNYTFSNLSVSTFILSFNHNSKWEGTKRIHFQIGKVNGKLAALCDNSYNSSASGSGYFSMNASGTNSGGWKSSQMRNTLLGNNGTPTSPAANTLLAALPSDLRAVMKSCTKYSDNVGQTDGTAKCVTATTDYLFLLAEFEYHGARNYANNAEKLYQTQYDYYKAGNSKVHYRHSDIATAVNVFCRSVNSLNNYAFCLVLSNGTSSTTNADNCRGIAPGFCL